MIILLITGNNHYSVKQKSHRYLDIDIVKENNSVSGYGCLLLEGFTVKHQVGLSTLLDKCPSEPTEYTTVCLQNYTGTIWKITNP